MLSNMYMEMINQLIIWVVLGLLIFSIYSSIRARKKEDALLSLILRSYSENQIKALLKDSANFHINVLCIREMKRRGMNQININIVLNSVSEAIDKRMQEFKNLDNKVK